MKEALLRELVCKHLSTVIGPAHFGPQHPVELLATEAILPHGRADIIAWRGGATFVIELKAGTMRERDVAQVLRYTYDLSCILSKAAPHYTTNADLIPYEIEAIANLCGHGPTSFICPLIVGAAISKNALHVAAGAGVLVRTYEYCNGQIVFHRPIARPDSGEAPSWSIPLINRVRGQILVMTTQLVLRDLNKIARTPFHEVTND